MGESPGALARNLAYLQLDLTDPDLRRHVRAQASATRAAFRALLDQAVKAGELVMSVDTDALARAVEVALSGSLLTWAFYQDGPASDWVRTDLDSVLRPHFARADEENHPEDTKPAAGDHSLHENHFLAKRHKNRRSK
jgi:hypothetical protein